MPNEHCTDQDVKYAADREGQVKPAIPFLRDSNMIQAIAKHKISCVTAGQRNGGKVTKLFQHFGITDKTAYCGFQDLKHEEKESGYVIRSFI